MFKDNSFQPEIFADLLRRTVEDENDRAAILIGTSALDELLSLLIKKFIIDDKESKNLVSGFNPPIGIFSARILFSYSLGLITKSHMQELTILRKLRNDMAHTWEIISLDNEPFISRCKNLKEKQIPTNNWSPSARDCVNTSITILSTGLLSKILETEHTKELKA